MSAAYVATAYYVLIIRRIHHLLGLRYTITNECVHHIRRAVLIKLEENCIFVEWLGILTDTTLPLLS